MDPYDALPYPGRAFPQSHPGRMAAQAMLRGLDPPPVETASVLELGGGDGGNLVPMAHGLPGATFVGIDLNERALARGRAHAEALGLTNVTFRQADIETLDPDGEPFDYVIAHGVYSWVPPKARDRLLHIAGARLSPGGIAYLSYNTKPGGHLRQLTRELMQFASRYETDPHRIVARAREAIRTVASAQQPGDVYAGFLDEYLTRVLERSDAGLFHDDLETHNDPVSVEEIAAHAGHHGLRYLGEAELHESSLGNLPSETSAALDAFEPRSELEQEQALDFLRLRMYRQTLFTRADAPPPELPSPAHTTRLNAYSPMRPDAAGAVLDDESMVVFEGRHGSKLRTDRPAVKEAFARLGERWPACLPVADLGGDDPDAVRQALLGAHAAGLLQLTTHAPPIATEPGDHPVAGAVARTQAARGDAAVTNLKHEHIPIADEQGAELIASLDGTRARATVSETLLERLADLALLTTDR